MVQFVVATKEYLDNAIAKIPSGPPGKDGVDGAPGPVATPGQIAQAIATAQGYWTVVSDTPPTQATMYGVPVLWIDGSYASKPVPVVPTEPLWTYGSPPTVTVPDLVGVEYMLADGSVLVPGQATPLTGSSSPLTVTVTAVAKFGYTLPSDFSWTKTFVDPSTMRLWASDGFTGAAGTLLLPQGYKQANPPGRVLDMALGGSASPAPAWHGFWSGSDKEGHVTLTGDGGAKFTPTTGTFEESVALAVGTRDMVLDLEIVELDHQSGGSVTVVLSCDFFHRNSMPVRIWTGADGAAKLTLGGEDTYTLGPQTSATAGAAIGTWRFISLGKELTAITPAGENFTRSFAATADADLGTEVTFGFYGSETATGSVIGKVEVRIF